MIETNGLHFLNLWFVENSYPATRQKVSGQAQIIRISSDFFSTMWFWMILILIAIDLAVYWYKRREFALYVIEIVIDAFGDMVINHWRGEPAKKQPKIAKIMEKSSKNLGL